MTGRPGLTLASRSCLPSGASGRSTRSNWKSQFFQSAGSGIRNYPALKALVYFNNHNTYKAGDIRVNTTSTSLSGYKSMLRSFGTPR